MIKHVIIGGNAGGMSAATRLRRMDESAQIIVLEKSSSISTASCGLAYYVGNIIENSKQLTIQDPQQILKRYNIEVKTLSEVVKILPQNNTVEVHDLQNNSSYILDYDNLLIATGAHPLVPKFDGLDQAQNVFTLHTIVDADKIKTYITQHQVKSAVIAGGGFVGLEMIENLTRLGIKVTMVELMNQLVPAMDYEMAQVLHKYLAEKGIEVILNNGIKSFANQGSQIILNDGKTIDTQLCILAIGVVANTALAKEAGIAVNEKSQIQVNQFLETSHPQIYAIGDAIQIWDQIIQKPCYVPMAWNVHRQARIVADNMSGRRTTFEGSINTGIARIFDLQMAVTGLNEKNLKQQNIEYRVIHAHPYAHAKYYPGAKRLYIKMIFSPDGLKIYGAQILGTKSVDKQIDILATAIKGHLNVWDLQDLHLAYSPSFSSAKHPVNTLGYMAGDLCEGLISSIQVADLQQAKTEDIYVLDVRNYSDLQQGTIPNSRHIQLEDLRSQLESLPKDREIVVYCESGSRSYSACRLLQQNGFRVINLDGGYLSYQIQLE